LIQFLFHFYRQFRVASPVYSIPSRGPEMSLEEAALGATLSHPLKILVIGAGIGGLTAAIGLRQQGHEVVVRRDKTGEETILQAINYGLLTGSKQVLEQSKFANETGAAIHLAPNCNGILRRLGIYAEAFGANTFNKVI
jgi:hypothetical protein